mmetsp:Transcript_18644/g.43233  ORF Transcript_18644/g.43233 Transcript_18644/m.43233 type:complete len:312 (-) Transcript_18644:1040-1975(-)
MRSGGSQMLSRGGIDGLPEQKGMIDVLSMIHLFVRLAESPAHFDPLGNELVSQHSLFDEVLITRLQCRQTGVHNDLLLGRHVLEYVCLDSSQEEWSQNLVQFGDGLILSLFHEDVFFVGGALCLLANVPESKPRLKDGQIVENGGIDKVQETPQFVEIVLYRCAAQQKSILCLETLERCQEGAAMILQSLSFVDNQVGELTQSLQLGLIPNGHLVGRDDERELWIPPVLWIQGRLEEQIALGTVSVIPYDRLGGKPLLKFAYPIGQRRQWRHDEKRTGNIHRQQVCNHGNDLNGLAQTHFICQYTRDSILK